MAEAKYVSLDKQPKEAETERRVFVFVTSFHKGFSRERDVIVKEVLIDLRVWCECRGLQLIECDFQWGNVLSKREQESILKDIQSSYFKGVKPLFLNITSETLGWVPQVGHAPKHVVKDFCKSHQITRVEQDILHGAYRDDNENGLFIFRRESSALDLDEKDCDTTDTACLVETSHDTIPFIQDEKVFTYSFVRDPQSGEALDSSFSEKISTFLKTSIERDYPSYFETSTSNMAEAQRAFVDCRSHSVIGRQTAVAQIIDYIQNGDKDVPLVILGGPGAGKSSLMCKAVDEVLRRLEHNALSGSGGVPWQLFYHFVGAVPGSTDLEAMLKRLLKKLGVVNDSDLPKDIHAACQLCCSALSNQQTAPTVVFIDSLNQFPEDLPATVLSWLPRKLGPQMRCILSMIDNTPPHQTLLSRESKSQELYVKPLDMACRKELVRETLGKYHKTLRSHQIERLLNKSASQLPLWLTVACEQLHLLEDYHLVDEKIDSFPDDLLDMLEYVLEEFENDKYGDLVIATLCLLEASCAGLLESELLAIIGHDISLMPPSPFDEKDEKESSEKEKNYGCLASEKWSHVFRLLRPFLRPYGDSREGRLDFYHRAMSKAVRRRYFFSEKEEASELRQDAHVWWHKKLADYFETVKNIDRQVEEYPYQLAEINNTARLSRCLCSWEVIDKLYHEEYSSQLLTFWRKAGGADVMTPCYKNLLSDLEVEGTTEEVITRRHEQIARLFLQAGKYSEALELARTALKMEEQDLGGRDERLAELYGLVSDIYDERLKLHDFVSATQLPDLERSMHYSRKSITIRKSLAGQHNKFKLAMALMRMSFNMESWQSLTNDESILQMGQEAIDTAIQIFSELNDQGHYAEALMTKGVLAPRGSVEQLKLYNEAMDISQQLYGEHHLLTSRLYINIGITHEDNKNYNKAYQYFKKWAAVSEAVLGPDHPKTKRAKGVLKETRYLQIARTVGDITDENAGGDNIGELHVDVDEEFNDDDSDDNNEEYNNNLQIWDDPGDDDDDDDDDDDIYQLGGGNWNLHQGLEMSMHNLLIAEDYYNGDEEVNVEDSNVVSEYVDVSTEDDSYNHVEDFEGQFVDNQDVESAHHSNDDIEDASRDVEIEEHLSVDEIAVTINVLQGQGDGMGVHAGEGGDTGGGAQGGSQDGMGEGAGHGRGVVDSNILTEVRSSDNVSECSTHSSRTGDV